MSTKCNVKSSFCPNGNLIINGYYTEKICTFNNDSLKYKAMVKPKLGEYKLSLDN